MATNANDSDQHRLEGHDVLPPVRGRETDPTLMRNQSALRRSGGTVWLVAGAIFSVIAFVLFAAFLTSQPVVAWIGIVAVGLLFAAMLVTRFVVADQGRRLLVLAALLIAIAAVSLVCTLVIAADAWNSLT